MVKLRSEYSISTHNRSEVMKKLDKRNLVSWHTISLSMKNTKYKLAVYPNYYGLKEDFDKDIVEILDWCAKNIGNCGRLNNWYYVRDYGTCIIYFYNESDVTAFRLMFG